MYRILLSGILILSSFAAQAGLVTGLVVGSMLTSSDKTSAPNTLFTSDVERRDTVVCCTSASVNFAACRDVRGDFGPRGAHHYKNMTPAEFAGHVGYTVLYKTSFIKTSSGCDMLVMEVGK